MPTKTKRADKIWLRLIQIYGARVAEQYGAQCPGVWHEAIEDLTDEQIDYGLRQVRQETPVYPPTLGQFVQASTSRPLPPSQGPSVQEVLSAYATLQLRGRRSPQEFSRPWTFTYREWIDATRPKGYEKCAEVTGLVIERADESRLRFTVEGMHADRDGYAQALASFLPGLKPRKSQAA